MSDLSKRILILLACCSGFISFVLVFTGQPLFFKFVLILVISVLASLILVFYWKIKDIWFWVIFFILIAINVTCLAFTLLFSLFQSIANM